MPTVIVLDHHPYMQLLHSIEPQYENQLDEESVLRFLFENLEQEAYAMERVEYELAHLAEVDQACQALLSNRLEDYRPVCEGLHLVIREMARMLWQELKSLGCYVAGRLAYYPATDYQKLQNWKISMRPLMLYNVNKPPAWTGSLQWS